MGGTLVSGRRPANAAEAEIANSTHMPEYEEGRVRTVLGVETQAETPCAGKARAEFPTP
jgi:hypothetical protein